MIKIENIRKSFGDEEILKGISTVFEKGKTNLIIGQSGSGKTVMLKCLLGLFQPEEGYIYYEDKAIQEMDEEQQRHWNEWVKWKIDFPGIGTPAKDWSKIFFTEGTTYQKLTPTQRAAATLGVITPTAIAPPEQQDIWQLLSRKRVLDEKIKNLSKQKKARIKQNQQNQPEE